MWNTESQPAPAIKSHPLSLMNYLKYSLALRVFIHSHSKFLLSDGSLRHSKEISQCLPEVPTEKNTMDCGF